MAVGQLSRVQFAEAGARAACVSRYGVPVESDDPRPHLLGDERGQQPGQHVQARVQGGERVLVTVPEPPPAAADIPVRHVVDEVGEQLVGRQATRSSSPCGDLLLRRSQRAAFPDVLDRIAAGGHEIGNHTWSHPYLPDLHDDELDAQLDRTNQAVSTVTGQQPSLVRPPYGGRSADSLARMAAAGMTTVLWDVESTDWVRPGPAAIAQAVIDQIRPGSIVLMHDGGGDRSHTVAALPAILDHLDRHGYRCVPVSRFVRTACSVAPGYEHVEPSPERPGVVAAGRVGAGRDTRVGGVGAQS